MRSLRTIFDKIRSENPYWSDYTCFAEAIRGRRVSRKNIVRNFSSLVDKEDYARGEKREIIEHLVQL
jgi:hypothetical protein